MSEYMAVHELRLEHRRTKREAAALRVRMEVAVAAARQAGASWTAIGAALGVSAQAACKRYAATSDRAQWAAPVGSSTRVTLRDQVNWDVG